MSLATKSQGTRLVVISSLPSFVQVCLLFSDLSTDEDDSDEDDDEMDVEDESEVLQKMVEATKSRSKKKPETLPAFAQEKLDRKKKVDRLKEKKTRKSAENVEPKQKKFPKSKNGNRMKIENYDFNDF